MEKLKLKDGTILNIESGATADSVTVVVNDLATLVTDIELLTEDNLSRVEILNDADLTTAVLENKRLEKFTGTPISGNTNYKITFQFGDVDMVLKRLEALEATQEVQDEAIIEIAELVATE